jgi:hypothetical protein
LSSITSAQIEAMAKTLVQQGIIDKSDIEHYRDVISNAIGISQSSDGLLSPVMSNTFDGKLYFEGQRPLVNSSTGRQVTRSEHDPIEIFKTLKLCKENEERTRQWEEAKQFERCDSEYDLFDRSTPYGDMRFDVYTQRQKTKEWFREFPFKCPLGGSCTRRFKTQREALNHRQQHALARLG